MLAGFVVLRALKKILATGNGSGRPATAATTKGKDKVCALILDHYHFTCELRAALGTGKPAVMAVIIEHGYRKVCARWVLKLPTFEH
jgi:hypothetical protein